MADVLVAIPSYRRPQGLARLLSALEKLDTKLQVEILVADNDADGCEGIGLCNDLRAANYRWPLHSVIAAERGIAQARNALVRYALNHSDAPLIAMLDDDEWPDRHWIDAFVDVQKQTRADALHGAVLREFDVEPGAWAARCQGVAPLRHMSGPVEMIHGTSNVLFTRACLQRLPFPVFDPEFALTGGEDKDFFTRLHRSGARFAWADEAIAFAHVPESRSNLRWALQRAYRVGNSDMRVLLKHERTSAVLLVEGAKIAGAIMVSPAQIVIHALAPASRTAALCRLWRAAGKIAAICGEHYNEYATVHGG
ncbi:MAG: glycosyltransferase [Rhizomicrobium sp.]|jgi:GT2 family glycosyltransferase